MKGCPIKLSVKVAEDDKRRMYSTTQRLKDSDSTKNKKSSNDVLVDVEEVGSDALPPLQHHEDSIDDDGWVTIDEPLIFL